MNMRRGARLKRCTNECFLKRAVREDRDTHYQRHEEPGDGILKIRTFVAFVEILPPRGVDPVQAAVVVGGATLLGWIGAGVVTGHFLRQTRPTTP